jgi:hypothetical protein
MANLLVIFTQISQFQKLLARLISSCPETHFWPIFGQFLANIKQVKLNFYFSSKCFSFKFISSKNIQKLKNLKFLQ